MNYGRIFTDMLAELRDEGRYRVFAELERDAGIFFRKHRVLSMAKNRML